MAPLCKFYQQGNCRNGANCRFEHPGANTNQNPFGGPTANRFNALNNNPTKPQDGSNPYRVTRESIKVDLADERPTWILSCYGPGKDSPEQLFGGYPREQSLEEMMLLVRRSANPQQAMAEITNLHDQAKQQIESTLGNLDGAVQFILAAENNHPNRHDICKQNTMDDGTTGIFAVRTGFADNPLTSNTSANQNPFSTTNQPSPFGGGGAPAFGQPSTLGQNPNPFGAAPAPAFGQPSQMGAAAPAFGQPSQMGATAPAFGQPSQMGGSAPAFGQPSAIGQRPNPFGAAPASGPSPFAQAAAQPAFGQPSTLGQKANPFEGSTATVANPFGQPNPALAKPNPFGQPGQLNAPATSPFGQPAAPNPFAQSAMSNDQSMDMSTPALNQGGFSNGGSSMAPASAPANPFGLAAPQNQPPRPSQPSQPGTANGPYGPGSAKQHPPVESYITKAMNGQITAFRGRPVVYKWKVNDRYQDAAPPNPTADQHAPGIYKSDGTWRRILFPAGPPPYNPDTEPEAGQYTDTVKAAYAQAGATGRFQGDMPEVPPMREDCFWVF